MAPPSAPVRPVAKLRFRTGAFYKNCRNHCVALRPTARNLRSGERRTLFASLRRHAVGGEAICSVDGGMSFALRYTSGDVQVLGSRSDRPQRLMGSAAMACVAFACSWTLAVNLAGPRAGAIDVSGTIPDPIEHTRPARRQARRHGAKSAARVAAGFEKRRAVVRCSLYHGLCRAIIRRERAGAAARLVGAAGATRDGDRAG